MAGIRWGKFSGRNRGAGHGGKGRKCDKLDCKDGTKSKDSECMRPKKGFWHTRCMKNLAFDIAIDIKGPPNLKGDCLPEVEKSLDVKLSALIIESKGSHAVSGCTNLQETELKKSGGCLKGVMEGVGMGECEIDVTKEIGCLEDTEVSIDEESGCMVNARLDGLSGHRKLGGNAVCNRIILSTKADCAEVGNHEKVGHEACKRAVAHDKAGDADSTQNIVECNPCLHGDEVQKMDLPVQHAGAQKLEDLSRKNSDVRLGMVLNDFLCGMSKRVMEDPVVVASGQTFERKFIQAWLDEGNTHCPITHMPLSHFQLIPNLTLKTLISSWFSSTSHDLGLASAENSFSSCMSSFSSGPSLMSCSDQKFVSCSSFSVSELLENMELHSFLSSSSSPLPKLLMNADSRSFTSSSRSVCSSSSTAQHLRERHMHNHSLTPSSSGSSLCWEQELCSSQEIEILDSVPATNSIRGESRSALLKTCQLHSKSKDITSLPRKSLTYTMSRIDSLVSDLKSDYIDIQRSAAAELRLLAKHEDSNRILITKAGALKPLMMLLRSIDVSIQLDATTVLLNLSLSHALRDCLVEEGAIEAFVGVLRDGLSDMVQENAAVALAHLAACEANRSRIGLAGAITPLVDLLERGSARGKKDAAAALYRLSSVDENKRRLVRVGALRPIVEFMVNERGKDGMVDKAMAILSNLVSIEEGRVALVEEEGIMSLLKIVEVGSQRSRGLAVPILYQLCTHSSKHRCLVSQNDPLPALMSLSGSANSRLKSQVAELIELLIVDA
ncbi:hypothetical protein L7F22_005525 [Adiantum nelumboides]|nr:hypothetical protein [Adiantum nelumboides]